ncbi:bifunctional DNA primase/polymerase, partial [Parasutterella excrementihominis]|uniref:bifunctional DNA primase/polymerase n=1 Tax=Parasutterella excrementihominis TaxID=487175 RepID=UPI0030C7CD36
MTADRSRGKRLASPPETAAIAVSLAKSGWPVFPVTIYVGDDGKRHKVPAVPKGTSWKDWATTDVDIVAKAWAGEHSGRWIGVHAGAAGIVALDVDLEPANGYESLEKAGLEIVETFNYETGGGGRHYVYTAPEGIDLTIARGLVYQGKPLDGIDVRSGSGLFVYYGGEVTKRDIAKLAPAPDWLLVTRERPAYNGGQDAAPSADESAFRARLADGKPPKDLRDLIRFRRGVDVVPSAADR